MSAKLRRQQDCKRYLEMWDKCKIEIAKQEKIALSKLQETANRMLKERNEFDQSFSPDDVQQEIDNIVDAIRYYRRIRDDLPDSDVMIRWPYFVAAAVGSMLIAYLLFGYNESWIFNLDIMNPGYSTRK